MTQATFLTIGKITGVHGLAGNLKVWSYADSVDTFAPGRCIMLRKEGNDRKKMYTIAGASVWKKGLRLTLETVTTREKAESLVGLEILVDKADLPDLEPDTWYWEDLVGLEVTDRVLGSLGRIDRLFPTGADDILVVLAPDKTEILIPMNRHFVEQVDSAAGRVLTTLPQGFITE